MKKILKNIIQIFTIKFKLGKTFCILLIIIAGISVSTIFIPTHSTKFEVSSNYIPPKTKSRSPLDAKFILAVQEGDVQKAEHLLNKGADKFYKDPLIIAIKNNDITMLKLISNRYNDYFSDKDAIAVKEAFLYAIKSGNFETFKFLIDRAFYMKDIYPSQFFGNNDTYYYYNYDWGGDFWNFIRGKINETKDKDKIDYINKAIEKHLKPDNNGLFKTALSIDNEKGYIDQENTLNNHDFSYYLDYICEILHLKNWPFPDVDKTNSGITILTKIDKSGKLLSTKIKSSSGSTKCDEIAVNAVKSLFPLEPFSKKSNLNSIDVEIYLAIKQYSYGKRLVDISLFLNNELKKACAKADNKKIKQLIKQGANINASKDIDVFNDALRNQDFEMVDFIIDSSSNPPRADNDLLLNLINKKQFKLVERLIGDNTNCEPSFLMGVKNNDVKKLKKVINDCTNTEHPQDIQVDIDVDNKILNDAVKKDHYEIFKYLIGKENDKYCHPSLSLAIKNNNIKMFEEIFDKCNSKDNYKKAYFHTIKYGNYKMFQLFTDKVIPELSSSKYWNNRPNRDFLFYIKYITNKTNNKQKINYLNSIIKKYLKTIDIKAMYKSKIKDWHSSDRYIDKENTLNNHDFSYYTSFINNLLRLKEWGFNNYRVVVLTQIDKTGKLLSLKIKESSGNKECDKRAIELVKSIFPLEPYLSESNLKSIDVEITLNKSFMYEYSPESRSIDVSLFLNNEYKRASEKNDLDKVKELIKQGANINASDKLYQYALDKNKFHIVKYLVENGYIINDFGYYKDCTDLKLFEYITQALIKNSSNTDCDKNCQLQKAYNFASKDLEKINYLKSIGFDTTQPFKQELNNYYKQLNNFVEFSKLIHYGYPKTMDYRYHERVGSYIPTIKESLINYFYNDPVESFDTSFQMYKIYSDKLNFNKNSLFEELEIYIIALLNTNFQEPVEINNEEYTYIKVAFADKFIENSGFHRYWQDTHGKRESFKGDEDSLNKKVKHNEHLWTLKKFFHRRGEFMSMLFGYYVLKVLEFEHLKNPVARKLYNKYGPSIQNRYNAFVKNWNEDRIPYDPYENIIKTTKKISWHNDLKQLKSRYKTLPLLNMSFK